MFLPIPEQTEAVAKDVVDAAIKVHTALGPGLLESVYEACLIHELKSRGLNIDSQISLPVIYEGMKIEAGIRLDLLAEKRVIIEIKAVEELLPIHRAQLLTYLKLTGTRLGLLINFNTIHLRDGINRIIN